MVRRILLAFGVAIVGFLAFAIFYPVFAQADSYSGPGMQPRRVLGCLQRSRLKTGTWPATITLEDPCLRRRPHREYQLAVTRHGQPADAQVEYDIRINGLRERWKITDKGTMVKSEG